MEQLCILPTHLQSIGQRIRHMRKIQNWSQTRLAQELDKYDVRVSISSINRWENDKTVPGPYYREHLCHAFHVNTEELFGPQKASPPLWNVPYMRNRYFTGREDFIARLFLMFAACNEAGSYIALSGLGGIGKTQVSLEYAYRYANEYEAVLWVRADTRQVLSEEFLRLADLLNLPGKQEMDQQRVIMAVLNWLHTHKRWLLILDNVNDLEQVMEFLPLCGKGQTLLTMRAHATGPNIIGMELDTLKREEGALLILRRGKILHEEEGFDQISATERQQAEQISELLGDLPLALDQVGTYIEENQCSLAEYLSLYQKHSRDLLKRRGRVYPLSYPNTVATTWSLSFAQVEQANPGAADLLRLCAFLPPKAIPEALLQAGDIELGPRLRSLVTDPLAWNEAIGTLRQYSLVRRTTETRSLNMHPLVQMMLKETMDAETYKQWADRATQIVNIANAHC